MKSFPSSSRLLVGENSTEGIERLERRMDDFATVSIPRGPGTPVYKHQVKTTAPASRLGAAPGPPRVPASLAPALPSRGSSEAPTCPRGSGSLHPARGSSGDATCHLGSSIHHLAPGSSGVATCPEDGFCRLQESKQISPSDQAIMISIWARTHPRHYMTKAAPHARKVCSRRPIKCR
jgi:hypothetical protein